MYTEGIFFGEVEQFYKGKRQVSVVALTECVVDVLYRDHFLEWIISYHRLRRWYE